MSRKKKTTTAATAFSGNAGRKREKLEKGKVWTQVLGCVLFSVVPILCFYLMEFYDRNPFVQIRSHAHILNILLYELIAWGLWFLLKKAKVALVIVLLLSMVAGLANHYVMTFRSTPLVPWDFYSIKTAASVAGEYDFLPEGRVIVITALFVILFVMICFAKKSWNMRFGKRALLAAICAFFFLMLCGQIQQEEFQSRHALYPFLFTPGVMVKYNGFAVTFAMDMAYMKIDKPKGYDREQMQELYQEYRMRAEQLRQEETPEELPNIIVIMDEAFSDLAVLGAFETNTDYMPFVHRLQEGQENTITGMLQVSVCGGNTANSEFEFLTGNTMEYLPGGSIPYQQYLRHRVPNLAEWLKGLGYETYAQHPYHASGWQRDSIYPMLGFDDLRFIRDYSDYHKIRNYCSDASDFEMIRRTLREKKEGKPAFIFNVTMQNHGGYTDSYDDFQNDVTAEKLHNDALDQYLSLIRITDRELQLLLDDLQQMDEKTILVFFGDHQPNDTVAKSVLKENGMDYRNLSEEETALRYQVPYLIWANYDIAEARKADTRSSFLSVHLLEAAGLPMGPYQLFLQEEEAKMHQIDTDLYQKMQYYLMFDEK